jgi:hypothetical protein
MKQCSATTDSGQECTQLTEAGEEYCVQHKELWQSFSDPTEAHLIRELARHGVTIKGKSNGVYTFAMPNPSKDSDSSTVYSQPVGYITDLAELLRMVSKDAAPDQV